MINSSKRGSLSNDPAQVGWGGDKVTRGWSGTNVFNVFAIVFFRHSFNSHLWTTEEAEADVMEVATSVVEYVLGCFLSARMRRSLYGTPISLRMQHGHFARDCSSDSSRNNRNDHRHEFQFAYAL